MQIPLRLRLLLLCIAVSGKFADSKNIPGELPDGDQCNGEQPFVIKMSCDSGSADQENSWILIHRSRAPYNFSGSFWWGTWEQYKLGFGGKGENFTGEYWLGLERVHQHTSNGTWELLLRFKYRVSKKHTRSVPTSAFVIYKDFKVDSEIMDYTLHIGERSQHKDVPSNFMEESNGQPFATHERPGSVDSVGSGWWYNPATGWKEHRICMTTKFRMADQTRCNHQIEFDTIETVMAMREVK